MGVRLLASRICERKAYRRALTQGQAVSEFDPSSKAAHEIGALWHEIQALESQMAVTPKAKARRKLGAAA